MNDERLHLFRRAQTRCQELRLRYAGDPALESAAKQLTYLIQVEEGLDRDRSRLAQVNLGLLAGREIADLDDELFELLADVDGHVKRMKSGF